MKSGSNDQKVKNFIDNQWVDDADAERASLYNPSTGEVIGTVPLSGSDVSRQAVLSSAKAFESWRKTPLPKRMGYIFGLREKMKARFEEIANVIALDQGKHLREARGEVQRVIEIIEMACSVPATLQGATLDNVAGDLNVRVTKAPLGVFAGVAPFNFPGLVFGWFIPFAIATGNTFVFKPSQESPLFMQIMGEIFIELGLPPGVVNIINGDHKLAEPWYEMPEVAGVCLVGSSATAKNIAELAGRHGKKTMLLGGAKNYLVVMEDANVDAAVQDILSSGFGAAGQRCLASANIAVAETIYDDVVERLVSASKEVRVGDARNMDIVIGPVVSDRAKRRIVKDIGDALAEGAELILDGREPEVATENASGFFVGPTILGGVRTDMRITAKEVFGPVLQIIKFKDIAEITDSIRSLPVGNGACIFTQSLYYAEKFIAEADVGMVGVNVGISAPHPYMPFGGIGDSLVGNNKVQGKAGIDFFTQEKVATVRFFPPSDNEALDKGTFKQNDKNPDVTSCTA